MKRTIGVVERNGNCEKCAFVEYCRWDNQEALNRIITEFFELPSCQYDGEDKNICYEIKKV